MQAPVEPANDIVTFVGPRNVRLIPAPGIPAVAENQILVRCRTSLISSGTELGLYTGSHGGFRPRNEEEDSSVPTFAYPIEPGYAAVGQVVQAGQAVDGLEPGSWVYYPGRHQRYEVVTPATTPVVPVPAGMNLDHVPYARFGQITGTAAEFSSAAPGDRVVVIGLGLIGNLAAQWFRVRGGTVAGADLMATRRAAAIETGIDCALDPSQGDLVGQALDWAGAEGARIVVEATGNPRLVEAALRIARPFGEVILLGSPLTATATDESLPARIPHLIHRKGLRVIGAHEALIPRTAAVNGGTTQVRLAQDSLRHIADGSFRIEPLVSGKVQPSDIANAYESLLNRKDDVLTLLVDWSSEPDREKGA